MAWFNSLKLSTRILATTLILMVTVIAINYVVFLSSYKDDARHAMVDRAAWFTALADETKNHISGLNSQGAFDHESLLTDLKKIREAGRSHTEATVFGSIPVVAGWKSAEAAAKRENVHFRITSFDARNPNYEPKAGGFEETLLRDLTAQAESGGDEVLARNDPESDSMHFMRAIRLTQDCLMCHGDPKTSPSGDGKDVVGFAMENWPVGKVHGAYHVIMPNAPMNQQVANFLTSGLIWTLPLMIGGAGLFAWLLSRIFSRPVNQVIDRLRDIAEGDADLTQRLNVDTQDELGEVAKWFNRFVLRIHDVVADVAGVTREVAGAATEIAASSEEMAAGMKRQTEQIDHIAQAVEEMSTSASLVAQQSTDAAHSAGTAREKAQQGGEVVTGVISGMSAIEKTVGEASQSVQELGRRGEQIGKIIEVINDIADQTNLLALNAAIEAARAGEHGRGFAVVADEVRKLADRTTVATEEVAQSIEAVQHETKLAIARIDAGTKQVLEGVSQTNVAGQNLQDIVAGAREVTSMVEGIATAAQEQSRTAHEVKQSIDTISAVVREADEATSQSATAATQLSSMAEKLQRVVGQFKTNAPAAYVEEAEATAKSSRRTALKEAARSFRR